MPARILMVPWLSFNPKRKGGGNHPPPSLFFVINVKLSTYSVRIAKFLDFS